MTFKMRARRAGWLLVVAVFAFGLVSVVLPQSTEAYGLLSNRSIRLSSSANGADSTAYQVGFTHATTGNIGAIVIKFCANSPIIGENLCTPPPGFLTNESTLTVNNQSGMTGLTAVNQTYSTDNIVVITRTPSPVAVAPVSFTLGNGTTNGIKNPTNSNTTFYARILIYASNIPTFTTGTEESAAVDAGGIAMSTANVLNVTAKVQETLIFCVWTTTNCAGGGNAIALGDSNGVLLDTATTYTQTANFDLASNALGGVVVKLKGDTLKSGSFQIDPHGPTCTADSVATSGAGAEQFGMRVITFGAGQVNPALAGDAYNCLAGNHKFDVANTNTTYGQDFVRTTGATDRSTTNFELAAKAAGTTEAGIYTTTLQFIATATY